jgi:hypothetical protein
MPLQQEKGHGHHVIRHPLIFQTLRLSEFAPHRFQKASRLPRLRRAGPSTSLDKSAYWDIRLSAQYTTAEWGCQFWAFRRSHGRNLCKAFLILAPCELEARRELLGIKNLIPGTYDATITLFSIGTPV